MNKFLELNDDKKQRIINAAVHVFSQSGYKKSTVDDIVFKAEISKGLIFHHFGSKRNLFISLYNYCVDLISEEIKSKFNNEESDFFEKIRLAQKIKIEVLKRYPYMLDFLRSAYFEKADEVFSELQEINHKAYTTGFYSLFQNTDYSKFKAGIEPEMLIKIITWCGEGFINEIKSQDELDVEAACKEFDRYLELFRKSFYSSED